jgi:hypothetical protein
MLECGPRPKNAIRANLYRPTRKPSPQQCFRVEFRAMNLAELLTRHKGKTPEFKSDLSSCEREISALTYSFSLIASLRASLKPQI